MYDFKDKLELTFSNKSSLFFDPILGWISFIFKSSFLGSNNNLTLSNFKSKF